VCELCVLCAAASLFFFGGVCPLSLNVRSHATQNPNQKIVSKETRPGCKVNKTGQKTTSQRTFFPSLGGEADDRLTFEPGIS
jgi:hypothetical protein